MIVVVVPKDLLVEIPFGRGSCRDTSQSSRCIPLNYKDKMPVCVYGTTSLLICKEKSVAGIDKMLRLEEKDMDAGMKCVKYMLFVANFMFVKKRSAD
nr:unnamed protein product [Callosobruchus chinensis]